MNQNKPQTPSGNRDPNPQHIPGFDPTLHLDPKIKREMENNQAPKKKSNQH
ncbi:MAG: hypothetical protein H6Q70_2770 [Firmicutes bacterium]|nr:hypothetical protein [Bacillota bacterium]